MRTSTVSSFWPNISWLKFCLDNTNYGNRFYLHFYDFLKRHFLSEPPRQDFGLRCKSIPAKTAIKKTFYTFCQIATKKFLTCVRGLLKGKKITVPFQNKYLKKIFRIKRVSSDCLTDMSVKDRTAETTPTVKTNESRYKPIFFSTWSLRVCWKKLKPIVTVQCTVHQNVSYCCRFWHCSILEQFHLNPSKFCQI